MKALKWLIGGVITIVCLAGVGIVALIYLVDWNDFRNTIENQAKKQTGRDLSIAGDLKPSIFPWVGVSIGDITLSNAEGFGDNSFAKMGSADVKVELLPLLKKEVNVSTIELQGLSLDLQRAADGTTNWEDLIKATEVAATADSSTAGAEAAINNSPAVAALAVGGIMVTDANVSWSDAQSGTDVTLANFNLNTDAIELAKPFVLSTDFSLSSNSMGLAADVNGTGEVTVDLDNQVYSVSALNLTTNARGENLPDGKLNANLSANIVARLAEQAVSVQNLSLDTLGLILSGNLGVANLDTTPVIDGKLSSNEFSPLDLFAKLGTQAPVTADPEVLKSASFTMALNATPSSAVLNDLNIKLDDTTFSGNASVPSLDGAIPPLRFKLGVDSIDLDRYLPPVTEGSAGGSATDTQTGSVVTGDEPITLPVEMMRQLDLEGEFSVGNVKISNLTTSDIVVPVTAKEGIINLSGLRASLYQGQLTGNATVDASSDAPNYTVDMNLDGIEADPLLADLLQKDSFLTGKGQFALSITTAGNTVNALTKRLNGSFNSAFNDGSVNGVNIGYQIRRAKAALSAESLPQDQAQVKTDFSALSVGGEFTNGVLQSNDLDMRSPLLRVTGSGQIDVPGEQVDYTMTTLITDTAQGQGGESIEALKGVKLNIPVRGSFDDLSANFASVVLAGLKTNITDNIKGQAEARAKAEAEKLKQQANERLNIEKAKAKEKLEEQKSKLQDQAEQALKEGQDKARDALKNLFK